MGVGSAKRYEGVCWDDAFLFMYDLFLLRLLIKNLFLLRLLIKKTFLHQFSVAFNILIYIHYFDAFKVSFCT